MEDEAPQPISDLQGVVAGLAELFSRVRQWLTDNSEQIAQLIRGMHRHVILDKAGWLTHHTTPFHLIADEMSALDITPILTDYYRENWPTVDAAFRAQLATMDIDDEAKATFREALDAHGAGLYRATVRVLFPEIERVARTDLLEGTLKGIASLVEIRQASENLGFSAFEQLGGWPVFAQFATMSHHLYERVETPDRLAQLSTQSVPNRHAALHGLIPYNSLQSSLSALIMAEFMFKIVTILKQQPGLLPQPTPRLP